VGKFIASETFNVGGYEWALYFYPDGLDTQDAEYVSVFIVLLSNANDVRAKFELAMHDQRGKEQHFVLGHFNATLGTEPYTLSVGEMWFVSSIIIIIINSFSLSVFLLLMMFCLLLCVLGGLGVFTKDFTLNIQCIS